MAIPGKENENGVYEFPYVMKPSQRTKCEALKLFIWNPSTSEFMGRTGKSWVQILTFYIIFYIGLAALFSICVAGSYATLDEDRPTYTDTRSLIDSNPGLVFRPIADRTSEGTLIWYNSKNVTTVKKWIELIDEFLKDYKMDQLGQNSTFLQACDFEHPPMQGHACDVNIAEFGPCSPPSYGYDTKSPCVFLKLNKIYDWVPEYYNTTEELPKEMPADVIEAIMFNIVLNQSNQVWVSCRGEYSADRDHVSTFQYYPTRGFPSYYFPFRHKKDSYLSPLIAVRFMNPEPGVIVNIECRAWAKNIGGLPEQRRGSVSVHFEIMRDDI